MVLRRNIFQPILLIALALTFYLHDLAADSLWEDEIFTAIFASRPPAELIEWTTHDIHPPLYYLLAGAFTRLMVPLGTTELPSSVSDWLWRFPSVMAGVLTVAVAYRLAFHFLEPKISSEHLTSVAPGIHLSQFIASATALLLCLAPVVVKYVQEARMHALFMFLSVLSTWLFFRALARPHTWSRWLAFALTTTANIYTMYFGFLILAAQAGLLLFTSLHLRIRLVSEGQKPSIDVSRFTHQSRRPPMGVSRFTGFSAAVALALLLYAPWWPVLFNILRQRAAVGAIEGGVGSPLIFIAGVIRALGPGPVAWLFFIFFIIGLILLARQTWPLAAFAGLWLALPAALPIFLGDPRALQFRYAFVLPVYLIVIAYGIYQLGEWVRQRIGEEQVKIRPSSPAVAGFIPPPTSFAGVGYYLLWVLATFSFIATLAIYNQTKPDWRGAAAYLETYASPSDIILTGPLWDEGRFIDYYYRGQAQLLTPATLVANIEEWAEGLRANGGRVWGVNRFAPMESPALKNISFAGVVLSEPQLAVYEPALLAEAALNLAAQAVEAAYPWAAEAEAQGVLNPDPRTAKAAALRAWGDALVAAGRPAEALAPYQTAVDIFPGWVNGFIVLAETQEVVGNLPAAAAAYQQAVAFNLKWQGPPADEAAALVEAGHWSAALEMYHQIVGTK